MKTFDVTLDISSSAEQKTFLFLNTIKDSKIQINVNLLIDGEPLNLEEMVIKIILGDDFGEFYTQHCIVTDELNGKCQVVLDSIIFFETGEYYAEIMLCNGSYLDTTSSFYFYVVSSIYV